MTLLPVSASGITPQLEQLAALLCGEFSNQAQAMENPAWFVQLRLWQRRSPVFSEDSITLFLEQAPALKLDQPYRQRLLRLFERDGQLYGQYYQFKDFGAWKGAGAQRDRLQSLTVDDVADLPGCLVAIRSEESQSFKAELVEGGKCQFEYAGQMRQVVVGFDVAATESNVRLKTYDKGVDPETGKGIWGALMGPYEFVKI